MTTMREAHDYGETFDEVLDRFEQKVAEARRLLAAQLLVNYPNRARLEQLAQSLHGGIRSEAVQINAITADSHIGVAQYPAGNLAVIPKRDSLCTMTVGIGAPVAVSDIVGDGFTKGHAAQATWGSWASVPIVIDGCDAGSLCALETRPRIWSEHDQVLLQRVADQIGAAVRDWRLIVGRDDPEAPR